MTVVTTTVAVPPVLNSQVLVLNKHYMAVRIISIKRAISLLFRDLAEVIDYDGGQYSNYNFENWLEVSELKQRFEPNAHDWLHTVKLSIAVPRIVRLLVYDRLPKRNVTLNRRNLFARDHNSCQYCGKKFSTTELSIDHVVPRSQGGKTTWDNVVCACLKCNVKKGGRLPKEAHMKLITKPIKPKRCPVISINLSEGRYKSWKQFLDYAYWSVELK
jgi:5-methylcytosine-specific restriction endonuclease McrA